MAEMERSIESRKVVMRALCVRGDTRLGLTRMARMLRDLGKEGEAILLETLTEVNPRPLR